MALRVAVLANEAAAREQQQIKQKEKRKSEHKK